MKFTKTEIPDVILIEPKVYSDHRGFFFESYRQDIFAQNGVSTTFGQDNHSCSAKGTIRGLHYQAEPKSQAKLVRVSHGSIFDVAVDIRKGSKTFGQWVGITLSDKNKQILYIPHGFAHGFCALEDNTEVLYKSSDFYSPPHERGILWNDPSLAIAWPKLDVPYILSLKDNSFPSLHQALKV